MECRTPTNLAKNLTVDWVEEVYVRVAVDGVQFALCSQEFGYHSDLVIAEKSVDLGPVSGHTIIDAMVDACVDQSVTKVPTA